MDDFLFSAKAKFGWAKEHLEALKQEIVSYRESDPYDLGYKVNSDATKYTICFRVIKEAPFQRWGLIAGDCLNNFRSTLDHAVYGLAIAKTGKNPPLHESSLAFPICDSPDEFDRALKRFRLGELREDGQILAVVKSLQPDERLDPPHVPALRLLRDLNDGDKHRIVHVGSVAPRELPLKFHGVPKETARTTVEVIASGPLEDGTEILSVTFDRPAPNVQVEGGFEVFPAISHRPDANGNIYDGIDWVLEYIRDEVSYCLDTLAGCLPDSAE